MPSRALSVFWLSGPARLFSLISLAAGLYLAIFPPASFSATETKAASLGTVSVGLWATGIIPEHLTALLFFLLAMLFSVAAPEIIFSGFSSAALWLVFAGLVMGAAVRTTGLGERIARAVAGTLDRGYVTLIAGVVAVGILLGFVMPSSMGRVILIVPVALAIAEHFGFTQGSNGRIAIVLAGAFGSHVPTFAILPSNVPNMVLVGAAETIYSVSPRYGEYLLLHFPILGVLKAAILVGLIIRFFPDQLKRPHQTVRGTPLTSDEKKLSWILLAALILWMSDSIHHISPAWVALGAATLLLLPRYGIVDTRQFNQNLNYGSLFFVAGVMGLGAMVSHTGLGDRLAHSLLSILPLRPAHEWLSFTSLAFTSLVTGLVTTLPGVPAVLTPLAGKMSQASGLPLETVLMTQVLGFSTTILPYQSAPLIVGMQIAGEKLAPAIKLCLALSVTTILVLWPLDFLWWHLLGWI